MNASVAWLSAFVDSGLTPVALRDLLTARVATVDAVEPLRMDLAPIVVARVLTAVRHPDSDHLWVTTVDAGGPAPLDVVCGAANVTAGVRYPFAPVGITMPNGMTIEKRKIRGRVSSGMLCSARELGLGLDHDGILPLDTDAAPGTPLLSALAIGDTRLVVDVLPNRPDLLSHRGLAREIAAATGKPLLTPAEPGVGDIKVSAPITTLASGMSAGVRIVVQHAGDAPAYLGVVIRGVRIAASPRWLVDRLAAVGVRSINNVVDVTNYMLHGYGQPTHAFDLDRLSSGADGVPLIAVRRAHPGERLVTLDGVDRALDPEMVVIADASGAQALGGVMGGRTSEVTDATVNVFLEIAAFDPRRTRRTRRALGLSTDASYRYERGVPPELPADVYATAVRLIVGVAGGAPDGAPSLVAAPETPPRQLTLRDARVERILGVPIPSAESGRLLATVGFQTASIEATVHLAGLSLRDSELSVLVPWFRPDIEREIDLIEEVARLRGYDSFPTDLRPYRPSAVPDAPLVAISRRLRDLLSGLGFLEARPIPFVADAGPDGVRLRNPMGEDEPYLRASVLASLARRAEYNLHHKQGDVRLFEIGTAFSRGPTARPVEQVRVAALMMGARRPAHFTEPDPPPFDEWDAKGLAERVAASAFPGRPTTLRPASDPVLWDVLVADTVVGSVSRVALDAPAWARPAFGVEITLETTETAPVAPPGANVHGQHARPPRARPAAAFVAPPSFPAVERDVNLVVPDALAGGAGAVEAAIRAEGGLLDQVRVVSEYRGAGIPAAARGVTWRLTYRHPTRTLTEKEVDAWQRKLLQTLETKLGVRQRTA